MFTFLFRCCWDWLESRCCLLLLTKSAKSGNIFPGNRRGRKWSSLRTRTTLMGWKSPSRLTKRRLTSKWNSPAIRWSRAYLTIAVTWSCSWQMPHVAICTSSQISWRSGQSAPSKVIPSGNHCRQPYPVFPNLWQVISQLSKNSHFTRASGMGDDRFEAHFVDISLYQEKYWGAEISAKIKDFANLGPEQWLSAALPTKRGNCVRGRYRDLVWFVPDFRWESWRFDRHSSA